MSLESNIADLVSASTRLTQAVNITRAEVDSKQASAAQAATDIVAVKEAVVTAASQAATSASQAAASLSTTVSDYAAQKVTKGLAAIQTSAEQELADRLHRRDPARHPFRGAKPSLVLDFVRQECHRNNSDGVLEQVPMIPFMTFTRGSTATFTGPDGYLKTAAVNQPRYEYDPVTGECLGLLVEEQRTNLWTYSTSPAANAVAALTEKFACSVYQEPSVLSPFGDVSACRFTRAATSASYVLNVVTAATNAVMTLSMYVKRGDCDYVSLRLQGAPTYSDLADVVFSLANGTIATAPVVVGEYANVSASISPVGAGWYRISLTATTNTDGTVLASFSFSDLNSKIDGYSTSGTCYGYFYGPQLEAGAFPTSYIPTPATFTGRASTKTYFDSTGVMRTAAINEAVTDYGYVDGRWVSKGLSLERAATNYFLHSADFIQPNWMKYNCNLSTETYGDPFGGQSARKVIEDSQTAVSRSVYQTITVPSGASITMCCWVKPAERTFVRLQIESAAGSFYGTCRFDLSTGAIGSDIAAAYNGASNVVGRIYKTSNGFFQCILTVTLPTEATTVRGVLRLLPNATEYAYTGDGISGVYMGALQLETGPVATSYIPTTTAQVTRAADVSTSSQVTRGAEVAKIEGSNFSSWYDQSRGTFACSSGRSAGRTLGSSGSVLYCIEGAGADGHGIYAVVDHNSMWQFVLRRFSWTTPIQTTQLGAYAGEARTACAYIPRHGARTFLDTAGPAVVNPYTTNYIYVTLTKLSVGNGFPGSTTRGFFNGTIRSLTYFPRQLSDADLQALTILEN